MEYCRAHPLTPEYLARAPRKEASQRCEGSNRYLRGRVLAQLREAASEGGLEPREIATMLRRNGTDVGLSRIWSAVENLEGDGLVRTATAGDSGVTSPGPAEAVAEDPSAYYAAPGADPGDDGLRTVRVSLP